MERYKSKSFGMDVSIRDPEDGYQNTCGNCVWWDDRTNWCEELESFGDTDSAWSCERWRGSKWDSK